MYPRVVYGWTTTLLSLNDLRWTNIAKNEGKLFEQDFKNSIPSTCWIYRLRDNASSFANGTNTRFTSSNICDYFLLDDNSKTLFLIECKSSKSTSIPLTMVRDNQIHGLLEASKHALIAGLLINFRNTYNDTFFITINNFMRMIKNLNKKSFNIKDLIEYDALKIHSTKKRTRYTYDINKMISELRIEVNNGNKIESWRSVRT